MDCSKLLLLLVLSSLFNLLAAAAITTPPMNPMTLDHNNKPMPPVQFDYYIIALTWPNSYCVVQKDRGDIKKCIYTDPKELQQFFTIHGLWPTFSNRSSVPTSSCPASEFKLSNLNETVKALANVYWPDVRMSKKQKSLGSTTFWTHEWNSHGICSNLNQGDYMYFALNVYDELLKSALKTAVTNCQRQRTKTVDIQKFQADLKTLFMGKTPTMVCGYPLKKPNDQYLVEIQLRAEKSFPLTINSDGFMNCDISKPVNFPC